MKIIITSIATFLYFQTLLAFECSIKNIQGRYAMRLSGTGIAQDPPSVIPFVGPLAGIGIANLKSDASLELIEHLNGSGQIIENIKLKGAFSVTKNCMGEASAINTLNNKEHKYKFSVSAKGQKIFLIMTHPTSPILSAELSKIDTL